MSVDTDRTQPIPVQRQTAEDHWREPLPLRFDDLLAQCEPARFNPDYVKSSANPQEILWIVLRLLMLASITVISYFVFHAWLQPQLVLDGPAGPADVRPGTTQSATPHTKATALPALRSQPTQTRSFVLAPRVLTPLVTPAEVAASSASAAPSPSATKDPVPVGGVALPTDVVTPVAAKPTAKPTAEPTVSDSPKVDPTQAPVQQPTEGGGEHVVRPDPTPSIISTTPQATPASP